MDIKEAVLKVLEDSPEPMRPGDIAQKAGIDKKEVDKASTNLETNTTTNGSFQAWKTKTLTITGVLSWTLSTYRYNK